MAQETIKRIGFGQVEPNHLSMQRTGQIHAQLPAAKAITQLENGQFAKYDIPKGEVNFTGVGEWYMVFNEVNIIPMALATIAMATPHSKSLILFAAPIDVLDVPAISSSMEPPKTNANSPMIAPVIVPANPKYNGNGICEFISSSIISQCLSTESFRSWKSTSVPLFSLR